MKKIFFLLSVLFISVSFGQPKKKINTSKAKESKTQINEIKSDPDNVTKVTIDAESPVMAVVYEENQIYNSSEVEVRPDFPGGMKNFYAIMGNNYQMPEEEGLRGKVYVSFVVEKDGSLTDFKVIRDIGFGTGKETIRVMNKMAKWIPAEQNGKKVRCFYSLPITLPLPK